MVKFMGVITRSILNGLILAIMVTVALLTVSGYAYLSVGAEAVRQTQQISRARGVEIGNALAKMAGERFDRDMAVKMSAVMQQVVMQSNQQNSDFIIDEILLLDASSDLMAHNDVALLAEGAQAHFEDDKYSQALRANFREPTRVTSIETRKFDGIPLYGLVSAFSPATGDSLGSRYPEKITTRTHVSIAVFPVDQELPAGAVHMFVTHKSTNRFVEALRKYSIDTLTMAAAFIFLITFIMILLMSLSFRESDSGPRRNRAPGKGRGSRGPGAATGRGPKSIVLDTPEPEEESAAGLAPPLRGSVLSARPANRSRRRAPLPGPAAHREPILASERPAHSGPMQSSSAKAEVARTPPHIDAAPTVAAEYRDDHNDEFLDDYDDGAAYEDVHEVHRGDPVPRRYREDQLAHNPYEAAAGAGGPAPYRPGPRIMDAIPLDNIARNKSAPSGKRSRL